MWIERNQTVTESSAASKKLLLIVINQYVLILLFEFFNPGFQLGRTKLLIAEIQAQASRRIVLGAALDSNVHSL